MSDADLKLMTQRNPPGVTEALSGAVVGIAGCGGLGSNVALALARSGVGELVLVDYDRVELSNLNRQTYFRQDIGKKKVEALAHYLVGINPAIRVRQHDLKLEEHLVTDLFSGCQVVVEAFDCVESKAMIIRRFGCDDLKHCCLVGASGIAGTGGALRIRTEWLTENVCICGDQVSDCAVEGVMASRVMVAAGYQATEVIRILMKLAAGNGSCP
jgi:sulfur carrier protein ThiS adenylyltransferase